MSIYQNPDKENSFENYLNSISNINNNKEIKYFNEDNSLYGDGLGDSQSFFDGFTINRDDYEKNEIVNCLFFLNENGEKDDLPNMMFDIFKDNSFLNEKNHHFCQNSMINDKSIKRKKQNKIDIHDKSKILEENESLSNIDSDCFKFNQATPDYIFFMENDEITKKNETFNINKIQTKHLNSQNTFSDFKDKNEYSLPNKSKNYSSLSFNNIINNTLSNISLLLPVSLGPDMTQGIYPDLFYKKSNSFNSTFSNKKRKRSKIKAINSFPNIENNFVNNSEDLVKHNMFNIKKISNNGRKKKGSGETGMHGKDYKDNLRSKAKTCSLKFLKGYFNEEIQNIDIKGLNSTDWRLYQIRTVDNKTKKYFSNLLKQSLKSIFSSPISEKSDKNINHNKDLIDKVYKINQEKNLEKTQKIIKFFNMDYRSFFNYAKIIMDSKNLQEKIDGIDDDIIDMIKKFEIFLNENLNNDIKDEDYNKKLIEEIKNFPSDIDNMKQYEKRKKNNSKNL